MTYVFLDAEFNGTIFKVVKVDLDLESVGFDSPSGCMKYRVSYLLYSIAKLLLSNAQL